MPDFSQFIVNHWILWALLATLIGVFASMELVDKKFGLPQLMPYELIDWLNHKNAAVIDIRSADDYAKGHIANAINIIKSDLPERLDKFEAYRDRPIILVCTLGKSVQQVGKMLQAKGFQQVMILTGGMTRWYDDSLPVVKT